MNQTDWTVLSLERLSSKTWDVDREGKLTSVGPIRLSDFPAERFSRHYHDFRAPLQDELLSELGQVDYIIHNGAEVHAIRSLTDPRSFVQSNTVGVFNMLEAARKLNVARFIYTSSAEVFGPAKLGRSHNEESALNPSNPYSAAKAGGEMLCRAYFKSFGLPVNIVRTMNMFGETQDLTKFVPLVVKKALTQELLKIHVRGLDDYPVFPEVGSRQWIYIGNYVYALFFILTVGVAGEAYNVAGDEKDNLQIVELVNEFLPKAYHVKYEFVEAPHTHDMRYNISDGRLKALGYNPPVSFDEGFEKTVLSCL